MSISSKFSFSAHALKILNFFLHDSILHDFVQLIYKPLLHIYKIADVAAILVSGFSVLKHFCSERGKKEGLIHNLKKSACPFNELTVHFVNEPLFFSLSRRRNVLIQKNNSLKWLLHLQFYRYEEAAYI